MALTTFDPLLLNADLQWRHLRALRTLRAGQGTTAAIQQHPYVRRLIRRGLLATKPSNPKKLEPQPGYEDWYDQRLAAVVAEAEQFLDAHNLNQPGSTLTLHDIASLHHALSDCHVIVGRKMTRRQVGTNYFTSSKGLKRQALRKAVLKVTKLANYPAVDRIVSVAGSPGARCIVLCENKDYLLQPDLAERLRVSLWFVGGNDMSAWRHSIDPHLTLYYACDWDQAGLDIYERVHAIYAERGYPVTLLTPPPTAKRKPENSPDHKSRWEPEKWRGVVEGGSINVYSLEQRQLIRELVMAREWIEEESIDLADLLLHNGVVVDEPEAGE